MILVRKKCFRYVLYNNGNNYNPNIQKYKPTTYKVDYEFLVIVLLTPYNAYILVFYTITTFI